MGKKVKEETPPDFNSSYVPVDITSLLREYTDGEQVGEPSRVDDLDDIFKWMRGTINAFYGWANDGKGTFYDFMSCMKAKLDGYKFCVMKQEDMSSTRYKGERARITANRIHKSLVWTLTGKTPYKHFSQKYGIPQITRDEYLSTLEFVDDHWKVIYPKDRRFKNVLDNFRFFKDKFDIDRFLIDPFKSVKLDDGRRTDWMMDDLFIECKEFALETNTGIDFIAHPKSLSEVRVGKDKDSPFKVVTQFMIAGGQAWDNNMDAQYSIYRPERHLNPADPKVHFHNLKQRNAAEVLAKRGVYEHIVFDPLTNRYYFGQGADKICPIDGSRAPSKQRDIKDWTESQTQSNIQFDPDWMRDVNDPNFKSPF